MKQWHDNLDRNQFYGTLSYFYGRKSTECMIDSEFLSYLKSKKYSFHEVDVILEKIISDTERQKKTASYYTPRDILDIFEISKPSSNEISILEPAVGAGQLLISYLNKIDSKYKVKITCYDISIDALLCTEFRLYLNGFESENISIKYVNEDFLKSEITSKFNLIISNPPYIEVRKEDVGNDILYAKGNLYALFMEKCSKLVTTDGEMYFIVPYSLVTTNRMFALKDHLESKFSRVEYRNFADRPASLFPRVHQKITLFSGKKTSMDPGVFISEYLHFYREEREKKLSNINLYKNMSVDFRYSNEIEESIMRKVTAHQKIKYCNSSANNLYINPRSTFWMKAFFEKPSDTYKRYSFDTYEELIYAYAFINSTLFYLIWTLSGDGWHVTNKDMLNMFMSNCININKLTALVKELVDDLELKKEYIGSKQVDFAYKHKYSKDIIDQIDDLICESLGLDFAEIEYIKKFNIRYRIGSE